MKALLVRPAPARLPARVARAARSARLALALLLAVLSMPIWPVPAHAQPGGTPPFIVLASTTSTEQSGLFAHLLPIYRRERGVEVRVVAVGTGQALDIARRGDADAVLVHDAAAEQRFVAESYAVERRVVMYNDFVIVGPATDPARARGRDASAALARIAAADVPFVSRGDRSGTHATELRLWRATGRAPAEPPPAVVRECGCGMGPALNMASALQGYTLSDRGTWLAFRNRGALALLVEGDPRLFNPYGVMVVSSHKHPHVKRRLAQDFVDWLLGPAGQAAIAAFRIDGQPVFFPITATR